MCIALTVRHNLCNSLNRCTDYLISRCNRLFISASGQHSNNDRRHRYCRNCNNTNSLFLIRFFLCRFIRICNVCVHFLCSHTSDPFRICLYILILQFTFLFVNNLFVNCFYTIRSNKRI